MRFTFAEKMNRYRRLCQQLDLPPKLYLATLPIGFVGAFLCMFFQTQGTYRSNAIFCLPLIAAPFLIVQLHVRGSFTERFGKSWLGCFIAFVSAIVPGGWMGGILGDHFHRESSQFDREKPQAEQVGSRNPP